MKNAPWFKFYPADFIGGVVELSSEERGSYITLLCAQWQTGSLPPENVKLERIAGGPVSESVRGKFVAGEDGRLRNLRLETHREEATAKSKAALNANAVRWNSKGNTQPIRPDSERTPTGYPESESESESESEDRVKSQEATGQKKELPATPPPTKAKKELVHKIKSMPDGFAELLDLFNDWLEARKTTATAGSVRIALQRVEEWGIDKARAILNDAVVGRWDGLKDYGHYDKANPSTGKTISLAEANRLALEKANWGPANES